MKIIRLTWISFLLTLLTLGVFAQSSEKQHKIIVAYATSWSNDIPDPTFLTHINYAFGHVNKSFNGINIANEARLKQIVTLKKKFPALKIQLSIGGWGSGGFSEMAADSNLRKLFAKDCERVINEFNLDGVDIDWEYPTANGAGISASEQDNDNFTALMKDIRQAIGAKHLLTLASEAGAHYIHFKDILPYINFVNIMAYDMASPPFHHAGLFSSEFTKEISVAQAIKAHEQAGVPEDMLVLGVPFYGRGNKKLGGFIDYKEIIKLEGYVEKWDEKACVPYLMDTSGNFVCSYDNPKSIAIKSDYVIKQGLKGIMYWDYAGDDEDGSLRKAVYKSLFQK